MSATQLFANGAAVTTANPLPIQTSTLSGGFSTVTRLPSAAASDNATIAAVGNKRLLKVTGYNNAAAVRYLKFYNKTSAPVVADPPLWTEALPVGKFELNFSYIPLLFTYGVGFRITTGAADSDAGALTAGDITALCIGYV